jgi:crotonobetainyl-CoA:carnitine CoA-transferase CaiB-like acyl-CoA transferase
VRKIRALSIPVGPINSIKEAVELAQSLGLDPIVDVDGSKTIANPIKFSETPVSYRQAPPSLK